MEQHSLTSKWSLLKDLSHLVYPEGCLICDRELSAQEKHICSFCQEQISYTDYQLYQDDTDMDKLFWGRVQVYSTYAHIHFKKNAASQKILFNLKYKDGSPLGYYFGQEIGNRLLGVDKFKSCDLIVPVPLHHKKAFIRGYNQSEMIADGISTIMDAPVIVDLAKRTKHSSTQTKKNRFQRWDNVSEIFKVDPKIQKYNHVMLVDDVITTGATMESLIKSIQNCAPDIRISVVTLAIA